MISLFSSLNVLLYEWTELGASSVTHELWPALVWALGCFGEQWRLRAQRPSQVLPTQAHFTGFCAILTAHTLHIAWVCVELGLFCVYTEHFLWWYGIIFNLFILLSWRHFLGYSIIVIVDSSSQELSLTFICWFQVLYKDEAKWLLNNICSRWGEQISQSLIFILTFNTFSWVKDHQIMSIDLYVM